MKGWSKIGGLLLVGMVLAHVSALAVDQKTFSTMPTTNNGKKWRIGYYEGGPYLDYKKALLTTVRFLIDMNWIGSTEIPTQYDEQTEDFWKWLATGTHSNYLQFVEDAYYSANWDENLRKQLAGKIIDRLNQKKDIDVMIAVGAWAGQDLANDKHHTPTLVIEAGNPVALGIIKSSTDSGYDHIHAMLNPSSIEQQIRMFYDIIGFKRLGVAYENSDTAKSETGIDVIETLRQKLSFELVSCYTQDNVPDLKIAEESVRQCFQQFVKQKVEAIYVTQQGGINDNSIPALVQIVNDAHIPTFSQAGSREVQRGFLLSHSHINFKSEGRFYAETLAKILNGAKPRELNQILEEPIKIAINLKTADIIGYVPPAKVLEEAEEMFQEIR
jgi:ABC-type uncharacterized transport system substrate-binding protein